MISLEHYVQKRNGVPLGHSKSLGNMLKRSMGATSFDLFWVHWNPIWNYYLNKYIYKRLNNSCNTYLAIILTFCFSGFLHDLVSFIIYKRLSFLCMIWFVIMGSIVAVFKNYKVVYKTQKKELMYGFNLLLILSSFLVAKCILWIFFKP